MIFAGITVVKAEGLVPGQLAGLDLKIMREVMNQNSANSYAMDRKLGDFILPGNFELGFSVTLHKKDLELALSYGRDPGIPLVLTSLINQLYGILMLRKEVRKIRPIL